MKRKPGIYFLLEDFCVSLLWEVKIYEMHQTITLYSESLFHPSKKKYKLQCAVWTKHKVIIFVYMNSNIFTSLKVSFKLYAALLSCIKIHCTYQYVRRVIKIYVRSVQYKVEYTYSTVRKFMIIFCLCTDWKVTVAIDRSIYLIFEFYILFSVDKGNNHSSCQQKMHGRVFAP